MNDSPLIPDLNVESAFDNDTTAPISTLITWLCNEVADNFNSLKTLSDLTSEINNYDLYIETFLAVDVDSDGVLEDDDAVGFAVLLKERT